LLWGCDKAEPEFISDFQFQAAVAQIQILVLDLVVVFLMAFCSWFWAAYLLRSPSCCWLLETGHIAAGHMPHATATCRVACLIATGGNRFGCTRQQHVAATPATRQLAAKTKHPHYVSPPLAAPLQCKSC